MGVLTKEQIVGVSDLNGTIEKITVPEWGGDVCIRVMTGAERDAFERQFAGGKIPDNFRAQLAAACLCDESGGRLFTDKDVGALAGKSSAALQRVFEAAQRVNGMDDAAVEELTGN